MIWLLTLLTALAQVQAQTPAADVSTLKVGSPAAIAELDLGKLKGDLRQIGWMADATKLYVQTAELQRGGPDNLHHYLVEANGGAVTSLEDQPQWAADYWAFKSDRSAPGIPSLMIDVDSRVEKIKIGPGSAGAADRTSNGLGGDNVSSAANVEKAAENQKQNVVR